MQRLTLKSSALRHEMPRMRGCGTRPRSPRSGYAGYIKTMNKKQQWILALLCTAGAAYAQDFRCKVDQIISAAPLNAQGQTFLNQTYLGKEFTVERRTGQMAGVLKILSPVATQVIDMGDKDNGFKTVATMRKEQGLGAASAVYALVINTFDEAARKPFMFTNNATAYMGSCTNF